MKLRVIITGTTGMVGEGVLHECLNSPQVEQVLSISRKPLQISHSKLKVIIHDNFSDISKHKEELRGYNACFFCMGVSSIGFNEKDYTRLTYDLTIGFAKTLKEISPDMTFAYVSGASTDSTEKGKSMWARVKGRTENELLKMFPKAYLFRPGYMHPTKGMKHTLKYYKYFSWMYPGMRKFFPKFVSTLAEVGQAMINCALFGYSKKVLEVPDIIDCASKRD